MLVADRRGLRIELRPLGITRRAGELGLSLPVSKGAYQHSATDCLVSRLPRSTWRARSKTATGTVSDTGTRRITWDTVLPQVVVVCHLHAMGKSTATAAESTRLILQLPHNLAAPHLRAWSLQRARAAREQLSTAGIQSACFWWTDHQPKASSNTATSEVERLALPSALAAVCEKRLVTFHTDVFPDHRALIGALRMHTPRRFSWSWYHADQPFVLASRQLSRWFGEATTIWYMEWDVAWTGDLGSIFTALSPPSDQGFGMGMFDFGCLNCNDPTKIGWQGCLLSDRLSFGNSSNPNRARICTGLIQLVWYSRRLLDQLYETLLNHPEDAMYCEAVAATACDKSSWGCQIDAFSKRAPRELFGRFSSGGWDQGDELLPRHNFVNRLYHPVKEPEWQGRLLYKDRFFGHVELNESMKNAELLQLLGDRETRLYGWQIARFDRGPEKNTTGYPRLAENRLVCRKGIGQAACRNATARARIYGVDL